MATNRDWAAKYDINPSSPTATMQKLQLGSGHETGIDSLRLVEVSYPQLTFEFANGSLVRKLDHEAYTVAWTAVLNTELEASRLLLDEEHQLLPSGEKDGNNYILGRMGMHNIVIAFPGSGGDSSAAEMLEDMLRTFRNIRFALLVGVGGGAPNSPNLEDPSKDIRLGDVVVGDPNGAHGGVIQYNLRQWKTDGEFNIKSGLKNPPELLIKAVRLLRSDHGFERGEMNRYIQRAIAISRAVGHPHINDCQFPGQDRDRLFKAGYQHVNGEGCSKCNVRMVERRLQRDSNEPEVHYKLIAAANKDMSRAEYRDKLRDVWGVSCFETEAAGLRADFPCLVIRGICDYSDDHKNDVWQSYAAVAAVAYAKDLLRVIKSNEVAALPTVLDTFAAARQPNSEDRIAELEEQVKKLRLELSELANRPIPEPPQETQFESGRWMSEYEPPTEVITRITFSKRYTSVPMVMASIFFMDVDKESNFRLNVEVQSVDVEGFQLRLSTWDDTKIYSVKVQWVAFGK
ncbi:hypothetical protein TWF718_005796 [Orbilia javanica]|uniref:H-type lectin domain-containing protein n=1 Tax=Orbilia javanica TaxID=47235 RepID=A0AAN8NXK7_9PEZI